MNEKDAKRPLLRGFWNDSRRSHSLGPTMGGSSKAAGSGRDNKVDISDSQVRSSPSLTGRLLGIFRKDPSIHVANMGGDIAGQMYYSAELKCWMEKGREEEIKKQVQSVLAPPPMMSSKAANKCEEGEKLERPKNAIDALCAVPQSYGRSRSVAASSRRSPVAPPINPQPMIVDSRFRKTISTTTDIMMPSSDDSSSSIFVNNTKGEESTTKEEGARASSSSISNNHNNNPASSAMNGIAVPLSPVPESISASPTAEASDLPLTLHEQAMTISDILGQAGKDEEERLVEYDPLLATDDRSSPREEEISSVEDGVQSAISPLRLRRRGDQTSTEVEGAADIVQGTVVKADDDEMEQPKVGDESSEAMTAARKQHNLALDPMGLDSEFENVSRSASESDRGAVDTPAGSEDDHDEEREEHLLRIHQLELTVRDLHEKLTTIERLQSPAGASSCRAFQSAKEEDSPVTAASEPSPQRVLLDRKICDLAETVAANHTELERLRTRDIEQTERIRSYDERMQTLRSEMEKKEIALSDQLVDTREQALHHSQETETEMGNLREENASLVKQVEVLWKCRKQPKMSLCLPQETQTGEDDDQHVHSFEKADLQARLEKQTLLASRLKIICESFKAYHATAIDKYKNTYLELQVETEQYKEELYTSIRDLLSKLSESQSTTRELYEKLNGKSDQIEELDEENETLEEKIAADEGELQEYSTEIMQLREKCQEYHEAFLQSQEVLEQLQGENVTLVDDYNKALASIKDWKDHYHILENELEDAYAEKKQTLAEFEDSFQRKLQKQVDAAEQLRLRSKNDMESVHEQKSKIEEQLRQAIMSKTNTEEQVQTLTTQFAFVQRRLENAEKDKALGELELSKREQVCFQKVADLEKRLQQQHQAHDERVSNLDMEKNRLRHVHQQLQSQIEHELSQKQRMEEEARDIQRNAESVEQQLLFAQQSALVLKEKCDELEMQMQQEVSQRQRIEGEARDLQRNAELLQQQKNLAVLQTREELQMQMYHAATEKQRAEAESQELRGNLDLLQHHISIAQQKDGQMRQQLTDLQTKHNQDLRSLSADAYVYAEQLQGLVLRIAESLGVELPAVVAVVDKSKLVVLDVSNNEERNVSMLFDDDCSSSSTTPLFGRRSSLHHSAAAPTRRLQPDWMSGLLQSLTKSLTTARHEEVVVSQQEERLIASDERLHDVTAKLNAVESARANLGRENESNAAKAEAYNVENQKLSRDVSSLQEKLTDKSTQLDRAKDDCMSAQEELNKLRVAEAEMKEKMRHLVQQQEAPHNNNAAASNVLSAVTTNTEGSESSPRIPLEEVTRRDTEIIALKMDLARLKDLEMTKELAQTKLVSARKELAEAQQKLGTVEEERRGLHQALEGVQADFTTCQANMRNHDDDMEKMNSALLV